MSLRLLTSRVVHHPRRHSPFLFLLVGLLVFLSGAGLASAEEPLAEGPQVRGKSVAVVDVQTGRLLHAQAGQEQLPMASTTKIMTALIAIERGSMDEEVEITRVAATVTGSRIYLEEGEVYSLRELLYALLLESANDAARAIAVHFGGSLDGFAAIMNERAAQLGLAGTHYTNPSGLHDPDHYTTAEDLAKLATFAMRNPTFRSFAAATKATIPYPVKNTTRALRNHNYLLTSYPGASGVKTGYTSQAGFCLVGSAVGEDGREVIAVILGSSSRYVYRDMSQLLGWGLVHFENRSVPDPDERYEYGEVQYGTTPLVARPEAESILLLERGSNAILACKPRWAETLEAPIEQDTVVGSLQCSLDGEPVANQPLLSVGSIERLRVGPPWWLAGVLPVGLVVFRYVRWQSQVARVRQQRRRNRKGTS